MISPWIDLSDPSRVEAWLPLPFLQVGDQCALRDGLLIFGWRRVLEARPRMAFETDVDEVGCAAIDLAATPALLSRQLPARLPAQESNVRGRKRWFELLIPDWKGSVVFHLEDPWNGPGSSGSRNFLFAFDPAGLRSPDSAWSIVRSPDGRTVAEPFNRDLRELETADSLGWGSLAAWKNGVGHLKFEVDPPCGSAEPEDGTLRQRAIVANAEREWDAREPARSLAADKTGADLWFLRPRTGRAPWPWPVTRIAGLGAFVASFDPRRAALERSVEIVDAVPIEPVEGGRIVLFVRTREKSKAADSVLLLRT